MTKQTNTSHPGSSTSASRQALPARGAGWRRGAGPGAGPGVFLLGALLLATQNQAAESDRAFYLRLGLGHWQSNDGHFSDRDCSNQNPPALFGCVLGEDGRPLGAYGDFGSTTAWELGAGYRFAPDWRAELSFSGNLGGDYSADANFLNVPGAEPVSGKLDSQLLMGRLFYDLPFAWQGIRPWVGLGAGWARHDMGEMTYHFPGLGPGDLTRMPGGEHDSFAWRADIGLSYSINDKLDLDFSWTHADLGWVRTDAGPATIVRGENSRLLNIDGTESRLRAEGFNLGLRYRF
jgi:opacity protein-like surface antigen